MKRPPHWGMVASLALVPLIAFLAVLQYRWIEEVSTTEEMRKRTFVASATGNLTADLGLEVASVQEALAPVGDRPVRENANGVRHQLETWRSGSRFPALLKGLWLLHRDGDAAGVLEQWSDVAVAFVPAPGETEVRAVLREGALGVRSLGERLFLETRVGLRLEDSGAVLLAEPPLRATAQAVRLDTDRVFVELDTEALVNSVLPTLVGRHFGEAMSEYAVGAISPAGMRYLYYRNDPPRSADTPDYVTPLFDGGFPTFAALGAPGERMFSFESSRAGVAGDAEVARAGATAAWNRLIRIYSPALPSGGGSVVLTTRGAGQEQWLLAVSHRAGSLAAAVETAKRRNFAVSFGILLVLAAGILLLARALGRERELARRERELVATVSHELKTPLGVILAVGQNLEAGIVDDAERTRQYGRTIGAEGGRLRTMIDKILATARLVSRQAPAPADREPLDPDAVVDRTLGRIRSPGDGLAEVRWARRGERAVVVTDPASLESVVENLLVNARLHGRPATGPVTLESGRARLGARAAWMLEVQDQGPGVPRSERARIFEPFVRGHRALHDQVPGTGMGLHIAREQARACGGELELVPGRSGARFRLRIPLARVPRSA